MSVSLSQKGPVYLSAGVTQPRAGWQADSSAFVTQMTDRRHPKSSWWSDQHRGSGRKPESHSTPDLINQCHRRWESGNRQRQTPPQFSPRLGPTPIALGIPPSWNFILIFPCYFWSAFHTFSTEYAASISFPQFHFISEWWEWEKETHTSQTERNILLSFRILDSLKKLKVIVCNKTMPSVYGYIL